MSSLTGNDTLVVGGISVIDTADGEWARLSFPNTKAEMKVGKGANAVLAVNAQGDMANLEVRVLRGSWTDIQLNSLMQFQNRDFASFVLLQGQFVKRVGDGQGRITSDTYVMARGCFVNNVDASSSSDGDTNQSISVYRFLFAKAARAIF